jgi:hypothetical protein
MDASITAAAQAIAEARRVRAEAEDELVAWAMIFRPAA